MASDYTKLPRLYTERSLSANAAFMLEQVQSHYLKNVLRKKPGDFVRLFNGRDGEWLCPVTDIAKTGVNVMVKGKIREQSPKPPETHLLVAPIKKDRMDFIIEKAVELGVTDIHPILTARTEVRKINDERLHAQIIEAAEQCERLDIPTLHPLTDLKAAVQAWKGPNLYWCRERTDSPHVSELNENHWAFIIGPEGGFDDAETAFLTGSANVKPLSLGETVLRSETAALLALGYAKIQGRR
jgi:16S rRNA (uracil1498-N3)-methyltransferase